MVITTEQQRLLQTFCTWLEQMTRDAQVILAAEQAVMDALPPGFTEIKLKTRINKLYEALGHIEVAHQHLIDVAYG